MKIKIILQIQICNANLFLFLIMLFSQKDRQLSCPLEWAELLEIEC
jgi:hypothetical protein